MNRYRVVLVVLALISLTGCAHLTPPPEPDMTKLVPANQTVPEEVQGRVAPQSSATNTAGGNAP